MPITRIPTRRIVAAVAVGWLGAAALTVTAPDANAYPSCGMGIPSISTPWGGVCDSPPIAPQGQHFHCQWGMGFELCEYRWADNTLAPYPGQVASSHDFGPVLR
jgi:hypothetical protein